MLSPAGYYCPINQKFASCPECYNSFFVQSKRPFFSLANNFAFGDPPHVLACLNDVELSLVARNRISGHIFTFHGGAHTSMIGMHSIYDVNIAHLQHSLEYMETLEFPRIIACVLSGPFTRNQKQYVIKKMMVDRDKVKAALLWLRAHNEYYSSMSDEEINAFPDPILIDRTSQCESENNNVEMAESFEFVFPDASVTETNGGCENSDEMKQILLELKSKGHEFTLTSYSTKTCYANFNLILLKKPFPCSSPTGGVDDMTPT